MGETIMHKVDFTHEAAFDYEQAIVNCDFSDIFDQRTDNDWQTRDVHDAPFESFNAREIKRDLEEYITHHSKAATFNYWRARHWCGKYERWLLLFIKRGELKNGEQRWIVLGICNERDWDEDAEHDGRIRNWYRTKIADLNENEDWVEALHERRAIEDLEEELDEIKDELWELRREIKIERSFKGDIADLHSRYKQNLERRKQLEFDIATKRGRIRVLETEARFA